MSDTKIDNVGILNQGAARNFGTQVGIQNNNFAPDERMVLDEVVRSIQDLLDQLSQNYPTETATQKAIVGTKVIEKIEENPTLKARVVSALKSFGMVALQEAVDNPLFNVVSGFLEGFVDP